MKYVNDTVRRQDRLMDEGRALELLRTSEYGVLSMVSKGGGYGIPVNYVWDGRQSIYIHCAPEGRKLRALAENARVSFCLVGRVNLLPGKFTTEYESALFVGRLPRHGRQIRPQELPSSGDHPRGLRRIQRQAQESDFVI